MGDETSLSGRRTHAAAPLTFGAQLFRPVQYLGNKLRVVDAISALAAEIIPSGSRVADLFAGSTIVSQAFARRGFATTAVDTQAYSVQFARALLGIGRSSNDRLDADYLLNDALTSQGHGREGWLALRSREDAILAENDATSLRALEQALPLAWRRGAELADPLAPLTSFYAGTYFGVRQALDLDSLANTITRKAGANSWLISAAMTALMHAASLAVHSAGKHFAQPLKADGRNVRFLNGRLLTDRAISVPQAFAAACSAINKLAADEQNSHAAIRSEAESYIVQDSDHDLYYLDPPYTAQQYSRFYHVLETISTSVQPRLPLGEALTSGLYPPNRYKSAFSSRSRAPVALAGMIAEIARRRKHTIISYSASEKGSNGNARMISLPDLLSMCHISFGKRSVDVVDLPHRYRQFNSSENSNAERNDREVLVICKPV